MMAFFLKHPLTFTSQKALSSTSIFLAAGYGWLSMLLAAYPTCTTARPRWHGVVGIRSLECCRTLDFFSAGKSIKLLSLQGCSRFQ